MKIASLEVNGNGKFKFVGSQRDFTILIMVALKTFENDTKNIYSKDARIKLYKVLISFINDIINKIERN